VALSATVGLSSEDLRQPTAWGVRVELHNDGSEPVRLSTATMLGPVSFEVVDAGDRCVPLGPPPTPPTDLAADVRTIEPGASLRLEFYGDELFADTPAPGSYRLRFAGHAPGVGDTWEGSIISPWVAFTVTGWVGS
jgi:hypothetical protein